LTRAIVVRGSNCGIYSKQTQLAGESYGGFKVLAEEAQGRGVVSPLLFKTPSGDYAFRLNCL